MTLAEGVCVYLAVQSLVLVFVLLRTQNDAARWKVLAEVAIQEAHEWKRLVERQSAQATGIHTRRPS